MSANAIDLRSDAVGCPDYWGKSYAICFYRLACLAAFEGGDEAGEAGRTGAVPWGYFASSLDL